MNGEVVTIRGHLPSPYMPPIKTNGAWILAWLTMLAGVLLILIRSFL